MWKTHNVTILMAPLNCLGPSLTCGLNISDYVTRPISQRQITKRSNVKVTLSSCGLVLHIHRIHRHCIESFRNGFRPYFLMLIFFWFNLYVNLFIYVLECTLIVCIPVSSWFGAALPKDLPNITLNTIEFRARHDKKDPHLARTAWHFGEPQRSTCDMNCILVNFHSTGIVWHKLRHKLGRLKWLWN